MHAAARYLFGHEVCKPNPMSMLRNSWHLLRFRHFSLKVIRFRFTPGWDASPDIVMNIAAEILL